MIYTPLVPLDKLRSIRRIVVHKDCPDGMASAILLVDALAAKVDFIQNGTAEHVALRPEPGLLLCDIAPHPERAAEFAQSEDVVVLDHHASVRAIVEACPYHVYATEDTAMSGATLAFWQVWIRLHPDRELDGVRQRAGDFAHLASMRDTFQRQDARWTEACAQAEVLRFYGDFKYWPRDRAFLDANWWKNRMQLGPVLLERRAATVQRDLGSAMRFTTEAGTRVLVLNGLGQATDVADAAKDIDLVIGFLYTTDAGTPLMIVTLRSTEQKFNCMAFSKVHGGGGHVAAAGFRRRVRSRHQEPYTYLRRLVERYENTLKASFVEESVPVASAT